MSGPWIGLMVALWLVVLVSLVLILGLIRRVQELESGMPGSVGVLPEVEVGSRLPLPSGYELLLDAAGLKRAGVLLFLRSGCGPCARVADALAGDVSDWADDLALASLIVVGDPAGAERFPTDRLTVVPDEDNVLYDAFGVRATPAAIAVDRYGVVRGTAVPQSVADVASLARVCAKVSSSAPVAG